MIFTQPSCSARHQQTFLDDLLFTDWSLLEHAPLIRSICYEEDEDVRVIAPFWAEFFDVATNARTERVTLPSRHEALR
jgi:hypothetical protein